MQQEQKSNAEFAPWRKKFLNVLERTFTELNLEFTNFSIGQVSNGDFKKRYFDANIQGIEFADEITVCSAIVNDCLASSILNGTIDTDKPDEFKFYNVRREENINEESAKRVDIVLQRVHQKRIIQLAAGETPSAEEFEPVYIEAKRAKRYFNQELKKDFVSGRLTTIDLKRFDFSKKRFNYILVWGIWDKENEKQNTPQNYINGLDNINFEFENFVRWIPLSWPKEENTDPPKELIIARWCWILLSEVKLNNHFNNK